MSEKRMGKQTICFPSMPSIVSGAAVVGPKEGRGPLAHGFDEIMEDALNEQRSFELAEQTMLQKACERCLQKARMEMEQVDVMLGGDLLNQIIATSLTARALQRPFLGLYGACSTMAESLLIGSMMVDGGYAKQALCTAGSHYCTAERQFRYPLEYGNQRTPAAQWTVTGSGAYLLGHGKNPWAKITCATIGKVVDYQIKDANNMGAAMAPAAADTLLAHFQDTGRGAADYDRIFTGDLGMIGSTLLKKLMEQAGMPLTEEKYQDCGLLIFDPQDDVHAGGSGCGCSASTFAGYVYKKMRRGELDRGLIMSTGALLSTISPFQGESIPGIAHAVSLVSE